MDSQDRRRLKRLLFNLLYPAVLGTFFVSLLPATADSLRGGVSMKVAVCWLIVAHFVIDYVFTEEVRNYRAAKFFLDLLVVVVLYVGFTAVHLGEPEPIGVRIISLAMAGAYACFLGWEYLSREEIGAQPVLTAYESIAAIWFLVAGLVAPKNVWMLLVGLSVATIANLVVCGGVMKRYHHGGGSTGLEGVGQ